MGNAYNNASLLVTPNGYKASKIYSAKPTDGSGDLAFSRASTAMRRNSAGLWESVASNVPRLQYPVGGGCPSWLFELQATNVFLGSEFTENTNWFPVNCSKVLNSIQSPKEGFLATKVVEDTSNDVHINLQVAARASDATYTISFYAKTNGRNIGVVNNGLGFALDAKFDLTAGTASGNGNPTITDAGNGWWLCSCSYNPSISTFNIQLRLLNGTTASYLGDGVSGAYIWNTQYELGSVATSPIITAGSAVTRLVDSYSRTLSPINQGSAIVKIPDNISVSGGGTHFFGIFILAGTGIGLYLSRISNGRNRLWTQDATTIFQTTVDDLKLGITWNGTGISVWQNGIKVVTDFSFALTGVINLLSSANLETSNLIDEIVLYNTVLSDTEMGELTTL
jgi:hypothetical protein